MTQNTDYKSLIASTLNKMESMQARITELEAGQKEAIAVVGMGCRFPGGIDSPVAYWDFCQSEREAIAEMPEARWQMIAKAYAQQLNLDKKNKLYGGFLQGDVSEFDARFFSISAREAMSMDPQQRLLLEVTWEALENANLPPTNLAGAQVGVFVGITSIDHAITVYKSNGEQIDSFFGTGNALSAAAGRLSYFFNLRGPCMSIDTACASSLVAVHQAIRSLRNRECELALVAGVNLILNPAITHTLSQAGMLAIDGRCKTFDATADGYGRGEGCGVLVLKTLSAAQKNGDRILGILRGSAVNHNGSAAGLTVPSGPAQQELFRQALADARVTPEAVGYIEAHGTGTSLGDPIEMNAIAAVYGQRSDPLYVGSVKTNLGHLEAAAGMAGIIKTILMLQQGKILPHLNFHTPNPLINWQDNGIRIPTEIQPWPNSAKKAIAGVSAFGFAGSNAHVIVEQAPQITPKTVKQTRPSHLLTLSAQNFSALKQLAQRFQTRLDSQPDLGDLTYTSAIGRANLSERLAIVADTLPELQQRLAAFTNENSPENLSSNLAFYNRFSQEETPKIVFLFTGQGACYAGMGEQLYQTHPTFRQIIDHCAEILANYLDFSLTDILWGEHSELIQQTAYAQPAIFALEYAVTKLWQSWGINPSLLIGHSVGEYVAACIAGVFSLEAGLELIVKRGQLMQNTAPGKMASIFADQAVVLALLENYQDQVEIAAINHPQQIVISGEPDSVEQIIDHCRQRKIATQYLAVTQGFHSPLMEPILVELENAARQITYHPPKIPVISSLNGQNLKQTPDASYWRQQSRQAVQYLASLETALEKGYTLFLEVGSRPILSEQGRRYQNEAIWLGSLNKGVDNWQTLLAAMGQLYVHGVPFDGEKLNEPYGYGQLQLPNYPFQRKNFQFQLNPAKSALNHEFTLAQEPDPQSTESFMQKHQLEIGRQLTSILALLLQEEESDIREDETLLNLGADSIILTDFLRKVQEKFQVEITIDQLFTDLQTVADIAQYLAELVQPASSQVASKVAAAQSTFTAIDDPNPDQELRTYLSVINQLQPITTAYIIQALKHLGLELTVGASWKRESLGRNLAIAPKYQRLLIRYLGDLTEAGVITAQNQGWRVEFLPQVFDPAIALNNLRTLCPAAQPELAMLQRCGENLAAVLQGNLDPLTLIFPEGSVAHASSIYGHSPVSRLMNQRVAEIINQILGGFSPSDRPYPILEIGGGTGATTETILNQLDLSAIAYSFSELSPFLLNQARQKFQGNHPITFHLLDIEKSPQAQGLSQQAYQIAIAANVLHATRDLSETLSHIRGLIRPGGYLILLETVENNPWLDLTFGLTPGWWRFQDQNLRSDSPLLSGENWCSLLKRCGFATAVSLSRQNNLSIDNGQEIILATVAAPLFPPISPTPSPPLAVTQTGQEALMLAQLQSLKDLQQLHEKTILKQLDLLQSTPLTTQASQAIAEIPRPPLPVLTASQTLTPSVPSQPTPQKPSSPRLNPLALKLTESQALTQQQQAFIDTLEKTYNQKTAKSKIYSQNSRQTMVDVKPTIDFRLALKEFQYPIVADSAKGAHFRDLDGNNYIDLAMGFGVNFFGHSPDFVIEAVQQQMEQGISLGMQSKLAAETAALVSQLGKVERVAFSNTGTEAIMGAVRIARSRTKRQKIVIFAGSYHGTFDGILARSGEESTVALPLSLGTPPGMTEEVMVLSYGVEESLEIIAAQGDQLAAVLVEPVQSRKPDLQPQAFLRKLRQLTHEKGIALIFDEIITGFRIAPGGAQQWFGVEADLVIHGKAIGGGLPISMICGKADFLDTVDGGFWSYGDDSHPQTELTAFGGTFCRHPLALAACRAVLLHLQEHSPTLQTKVNQLTERLATEINAFFEEVNIPIRLVYFGSLFRFEPFGAYSLFLQPIELPLFYYLLILKGIYTWEKRVCFLSTEHTQEDIDKVIVAVKESILELQQAGFFTKTKGSQTKKSQLATPLRDDGGSAREDFGSQTFATNEAQRQLWLLSELDRDASVAYNVTTSLELKGSLNISALEEAINEVVNRHEALRTHILEQGELQTVIAEVKLSLNVIDLSERANPEAEALALRKQLSQQPFDLGIAPLLTPLLICLKPAHYLLSLKTHHIVADGWSLGLILNEIGQLYPSKINQIQTVLTPPMQFRQYLALREQAAQSPEMAAHREFWLETYGDDLPTFELPTDFPRPAIKTYRGGQASQQIDPELWQKLKKVGRKHQATLFMTMFAAYTAFLCRFSGQNDLVIGIPISGRQIEGSDQLVGFCSQFLPVRVQVDLTLTFIDHLQNVKRNLIATFKHQSYTLEDLLADLQLQRDFSRAPLISVSFNMDPSLTLPTFEGLEVALPPEPLGYTPFDIGFNLIELNNHLILYCNYNTEIFKPATIQQFLASFEILLWGIVDNTQSLLHRIPLLTPNQEQVLLTALRGENRPIDDQATIMDDFVARVRETPHAPAVIAGKTILSYQVLNEKTNRLANYLQGQYQLGAGKAIAVILGRNPNLIIAILAVFKTGATYVPIDAQYPKSRIEFILQDSACQICLTESDLASKLPKTVDKLCLDNMDSLLLKGDKNDPPNPPDASQIAYIFYTSGSTGNPKGVMGRHLSIVNVIQSLRLTFNLDDHPEWRYIFTAAVTHDPSIRNIFLPLTIGAPLYLYEIKYIGHLVNFLQENQINALHTTPSIYREILALLEPEETIPSLKYISVGGEKLDQKTALALRHCFQAEIVSNVYGSTETCVGVSQYAIPENLATDVPLGLVFHNNRLLILDDFDNVVPLQMIGEICVEGAAIAAGYHNLPDLTQKKFQASFLDCQQTLFRTGDLGKQVAPGVIEFIGRKDNQVKVNGYRIDPKEIESQLNRHPQIEKAIILSFQINNQTQLSAYCQTEQTLEIADIREFLADLLPAYMIPSYFVFLKQFPLTRHGKLDLHSLVNLQEKGQSTATDYVAPRNQLESHLVTIWEKLLSQHPIGIFDNFFEIGGHSLLLSRVVTHVHKELNISVKIADFFKVPTIAGLAVLVSKTEYDYQEPIAAIAPQKSYPMSHGQRRLWALEFLDGNGNHNAYGMPSAYRFQGHLNLEAFDNAFQGLIQRHEILRTTFHLIDNEPRQVVHGQMNFAIKQLDLSELAETGKNLKIAEAILHNAQTTFDLESGPLIKVNLLKLNPRHYVVLFNMHHIISDGWSAGVLIKDFIAHYQAYGQENLELLQPLKIQYKDYTIWQENQLKMSKLQGQGHYWLTQLTPAPIPLNLPVDYPRPPVQSFQGQTLIHHLDSALIVSFQDLINAQKASLFMGLVTLVKAFLFRYTEQTEITVGTAIAGRNHPDLEAQIGFYVNTLVLRDRLAKEDSFSQLLAKVKVTTLNAYDNQDYPFDRIVSDLNLERDPSRNALFDVAVVLQNNQTVELDLPGITINSIDPQMTTAKFDLEFIFVQEGQLYLKLIYNKDIFVQERILSMIQSLENLLIEIVKFPEYPLIELLLQGDSSGQVNSDLFAEDFNF